MKSVLEADAIHQDISGAVNQSAFTLFYGQFRAAAPCVRHLITEAERRASTSLTEYTTWVQDLQSNYLSCRMQLLQCEECSVPARDGPHQGPYEARQGWLCFLAPCL
jgi:hypothetical protein